VKRTGMLATIGWEPTFEPCGPVSRVIGDRLGAAGSHAGRSTSRSAWTRNERRELTMKAWQMLLCGPLIAAGAVLAGTGAAAAALLPSAGCAALMAAMAGMMLRSGGR
jgi:hypothetical protein